jgi:2-polyprenyl-6-methoxyphenol hydroxylase-like FAD-dependent oxidoreductase
MNKVADKSGEIDVLIVGAGPTGLLLACELAAAKVRVLVVEKREEEESNLTRAFAVHARTLEILDAVGVADALIETGEKLGKFRLFSHIDIDLSGLPSRYPYVLVTPQYNTERVLSQRAKELGVVIVRGTELVAIKQGDHCVEVDLRSKGDTIETRQARYLVGTDGAHSAVRRELGMPFPGHESRIGWLILADVRLSKTPPGVFTVNATGDDFAFVAPFGDGWYRVFVWNRFMEVPHDAQVTLDPVRKIVRRALGTDYGMHDPRWISRFHNDERQVPHYRKGRIFLAGDAAHIHSPAGAQGMNTGLQDAANLGWKLGSVIRRARADEILDTYEDERHPVGAAVMRMTERLVAMVVMRNPVLRSARNLVVGTAMRLKPVANMAAGMISNIAIAYRSSHGAPALVGHRTPDVKLRSAARAPSRLYEALRNRRFVLVSSAADKDQLAALTAPWGMRSPR